VAPSSKFSSAANEKMSLGWKFAAHAASLDVEIQRSNSLWPIRFALRGFGFPPFPTLAAETTIRFAIVL
jgi:hypothetical protein